MVIVSTSTTYPGKRGHMHLHFVRLTAFTWIPPLQLDDSMLLSLYHDGDTNPESDDRTGIRTNNGRSVTVRCNAEESADHNSSCRGAQQSIRACACYTQRQDLPMYPKGR